MRTTSRLTAAAASSGFAIDGIMVLLFAGPRGTTRFTVLGMAVDRARWALWLTRRKSSGIEGDPERAPSAIATACMGAAPASGLVDLILVDEASQYDNREWKRFTQSVAEQPHSPFLVAVADFQQLQPVVAGGLCHHALKSWPCIQLDTVYRTSDEAQLLFLNRIREQQPSRQVNRVKKQKSKTRYKNSSISYMT